MAPLGPEIIERLATYGRLVAEWSDRVGLVSARDLERFDERHLADCLRVLPVLQILPDGPGIDVGSGAGLPGVPLAIAAPQRAWTLLEPRARRAAFLEEVVRRLDLDCRVLRASAEEAAAGELGHAGAVATARAVATPETSFALLRPLLREDGTAIVFCGDGPRLPPGAGLWDRGIAIMTLDRDLLEERGRYDCDERHGG